MIPYINLANQAPGFQTGPVLGIKSFHRLIMVKTLKIFFSETMRPTAYILGMEQGLVVPCVKSCQLSLWCPNWPRPWGSRVSIDMMEKTLKIFMSETMRPTAYIFGMKQFLAVPYICSANEVPGVQTGPALRIKSSYNLQIKVYLIEFFFLSQNMCCGYSKLQKNSHSE